MNNVSTVCIAKATATPEGRRGGVQRLNISEPKGGAAVSSA